MTEIMDVFEQLRRGQIDEAEACRLLKQRRRQAFWSGFWDGMAAPALFLEYVFGIRR